MDDNFDQVNDGKKDSYPLTETKRVSRNMSEKKRRDRFNVLIGELAAVVPGSTTGTSKFDKTTVLKKAVACLRSHQHMSAASVSRTTAHWQPSFVNDTELNQLLLEAMDGFVLVLDGSGIITFASDSIISVLGYRPQDVVNNSIADYLDQSDKSHIFAHVALLEKLKSTSQKSSNTPYTSLAVSKTINFDMKMISGPCFDSQDVGLFSCIGQAFTTSMKSQSKLQMILVCNLNSSRANLIKPISNAASKEFSSRLTLDWKFTYVDSQAMNILGFEGKELVNNSIYYYIHRDDIQNVTSYHEMLVRKGRITTCYYRFLTKGQTWIWLCSCCYISYNQWNSKPEYVTATTHAVNYDEVYANQEVIVKNDRLQFQAISRDSGSDSSSKRKRADSPLSISGSSASRDTAESTMSIFGMFESVATKLDKKSVSEKMDTQTSAKGSTCTSSSSFSTIPAPEGLNPSQQRLHMQLQGKHLLLEKSIKHQITELSKIKRQIEINKQLWEFNRQLQEKKAAKFLKSSTSGSKTQSSSGSSCEQSFEASIRVPPANERMQIDNNMDNINVPISSNIPASLYLTLQDLDDNNVEENSIPLSLNSTSQLFAPLQPYNYFQY